MAIIVYTSDRVDVVRCKDCAHCFELAEYVDLEQPYRGGKDGFFCREHDMEFYTPHYDARTYYCADGVKRQNGR